jgi:heptosyltransferase-2
MIHIPTARFIDRYAGILLCALLNLLGRITGRHRETVSLDSVRNILIIKFWGLGNLIEATPTFRAIRGRFPDARITFLTLAGNRGVFDHYPHFDEIIYMQDHTIGSVLVEFFRLPRVLRKRNIDLAFDLDPIGRFCALITFLSGARIRVGYSTANQYREHLYTRAIPLDESKHIRDMFLDLTRGVGVNGADTSLDPVTVSGADKKLIDTLFKENGIEPGDRIVGLNINASAVAYERRWPMENFLELANRILARHKVKLVLVGAPDEAPYVAQLAQAVRGPCVNLAGLTTLAGMAEVLGRCELFISNDSGPLHVAAAMGAPTVSFFGPETPLRYGPLGEGHTVFFAGLDCSPCISFANEKQVRCPRNAQCLRAITVDMASRAVHERLAAHNDSAPGSES